MGAGAVGEELKTGDPMDLRVARSKLKRLIAERRKAAATAPADNSSKD